MTGHIAYAFRIYPVPSAMRLTEFYQFVRRLANRYGGYRITPCYTTKAGSVLIEFGSHFGSKPKPEKARELKGLTHLMGVTLGRMRPDHKLNSILIENDRLLLDQAVLRNIWSKKGKLIIELTRAKSSFGQLAADHVIPLYEGVFIDAHRRLMVDLKDSWEVSATSKKLVINLTSEKESRFQSAQDAAHAQHEQPGEANCSLDKMRVRWLSGEYHSRDLCADISCRSLDISFAAAHEVLRNMPEPHR